MKAFKLFLVGLLAICFTGCFEVNEEIEVQENGTGKFSLNMEMGKLLEMMQAFMPAEELEKANLGKVQDTTIQMKDLVDTAASVSADKKAIFRDGSMRMQMNMNEKLFKVNIQYPFKSAENLQKLYENMGEGSSGLGSLLKNLNPNAAASGAEPDFKQISSYFDLTADKSSISRKLNKDRYSELATDSTMQQMKQMGEMSGGLGEVKMNTVIKLPRAAKKISGTTAKLASDKKSVILNNSLLDIFEHPEVFEFSVEY